MFGSSSPFGQSSSSPFGSQSVFGQTSSVNNNPFAPKPFGSTTPFSSQTGGSLFGGTSTGVFGAPQSSSPFSSTTFGASSSPAFGSSTPAFGASSTPAFGSSSPFGGTSVFGQKPAFGFSTPQSSPFGSATQQSQPQSSPFGSATQQSQPAFGSNIFGSSMPFGASNQPAFGSSAPAFGATSAPAFGATSSPAFGAASAPAFGAASAPAFGAASAPAFGGTSTPAFGSTGSAFGSTAFSSGGAFGASSTPAFGASSTPAFGVSGTPPFGASGTPAFGASSTPSFGFGSTPAFGQSTSAFGSSPFGSTSSPFGAPSSPFGAQASTPAFGSTGFGQSTFGAQQGGSRVAPYTPTTEADSSGTQPAGKLESISAMPVYKDKSHEELRWEDYQRGDKGGSLSTGQSPGGLGFGASTAQTNPFAPSPAFGQSSANLFSSSIPSNPFAPKAPTTPSFGSSPFGTTTSSNLFGSTSSTVTSPFGSSSGFGASSSSSLFGSSSTPAFGSSPSLFGSGPGQGTTPAFSSTGLGFGSMQTPLFNSSAPSTAQTGSAFGQITSSFGQSTAPSFGQTSIFNSPATGFGGLFSNPSSLNTSNNSLFGQKTPAPIATSFPTQTVQTSGGFGFGNFGQSQEGGFAGGSGIFGQSTFGQQSASQSSVVIQPVAVTNPFGTLPAMPQMSIGRGGTAPSIQYGISSMPVVDKPIPVRISSLLTSRHLSQRRIRLPARKYHPNNDGSKVPFFGDDEATLSTPEAEALFIPRENPRALVIRPIEQWPSREKSTRSKDGSPQVHENGNAAEDGTRERAHPVKVIQKPNGVHEDQSGQKDDSYKTLSGHRAGEAAIVYEHGADIEALMPKLRRSDYYTEPRIHELAAKERAEPGSCRRVKDFVVGRHGYGSIKFLGETDVRRLDLESLVQFNNREVIVYMDENKKPPAGQGLNKPAVVTLLNIKCFDKKTGKQYTEGPKADKYEEMLKRKAEEQGAEFVSYDPIKGEWKFRVEHFSRYSLGDEDDDAQLCAGQCC